MSVLCILFKDRVVLFRRVVLTALRSLKPNLSCLFLTDRHSGASDEVKKNEELLFKEVRDLRTFARKFSNIDFCSENFTIES